MEEMKNMPHSGFIAFVGDKPTTLPQPQVIANGKNNQYHAPIRVNRSIRQGVHYYQSGESIQWESLYH